MQVDSQLLVYMFHNLVASELNYQLILILFMLQKVILLRKISFLKHHQKEKYSESDTTEENLILKTPLERKDYTKNPYAVNFLKQKLFSA